MVTFTIAYIRFTRATFAGALTWRFSGSRNVQNAFLYIVLVVSKVLN